MQTTTRLATIFSTSETNTTPNEAMRDWQGRVEDNTDTGEHVQQVVTIEQTSETRATTLGHDADADAETVYGYVGIVLYARTETEPATE